MICAMIGELSAESAGTPVGMCFAMRVTTAIGSAWCVQDSQFYPRRPLYDAKDTEDTFICRALKGTLHQKVDSYLFSIFLCGTPRPPFSTRALRARPSYPARSSSPKTLKGELN